MMVSPPPQVKGFRRVRPGTFDLRANDPVGRKVSSGHKFYWSDKKVLRYGFSNPGTANYTL